MSALFPKSSVNSNNPVISSLQIQTSCYGRCLPWIFGAVRGTDNVIQYDDFTPIAHNESVGGKGFGGAQNGTSYTYTASVILAICRGEVSSIGKVWRDKDIVTLSDIGLDFYNGSSTQDPYPYFTSAHPDKALSYRNVSYLASGSYDLGSSANLQNHSFEIIMPNSVDGTTIPDANIVDVVTAILTDTSNGIGLSSSKIGDLTQFNNFCLANGIWVSCNYSDQSYAYDMLANLLKIGFADCFYSGDKFNIVPYSDIPATNSYATYEPSAAISYVLTEDDFLGQPGQADAVTVQTKPVSERYNNVKITYRDRANNYNQAPAEAKDQGDIDRHGLKTMDTIDFSNEICDGNVAQQVADFILHRSLYIIKTYKFILPINYILLEPMDILQLEYPRMNIVSKTVLITSIQENDNGDLAIEAEEYNFGTNNPTKKAPPTTDSYVTNFSIDPGNATNPVIFEPSLQLTNNIPQIWLATAGGQYWGGCQVWASTDNSSYQLIGSLNGKSRYGQITEELSTGSPIDIINNISVDISASGGALISGTEDNANDLITLCLIKDDSNGDEYFAYETATLTGVGQYDLDYLVRGAYGSNISSHAINSPFVRVDDGVFKYSYPYSWLGKTIYIKLVSFNKFNGGGLQDISAVSYHSYSVIGAPVGVVQNLHFVQDWVSYDAKVQWDLLEGADSYDVYVYDDSNNLVRTQNGLKSNAFNYTHDDMLSNGGPWRTIVIKVRARTITGAVGSFASITGNNPQLSALTGIQITSGIRTLFFTCATPSETDFAGIVVYVGTASDFTPDDNNKVYDGQGTFATISQYYDTGTSSLVDLVGGETYYVIAAGYDLFGKDDLNLSSSISGLVYENAPDVGTITASMIQDGAVTLTKHATGLQPVGIEDTLPDPAGYTGALTILNAEDGKLYRYVDGAWTAAVPTVDLTGQINGDQVEDGAIDTNALASNAVTASKVADGAIGELQIANNAVTAVKTDIAAINAATGDLQPLTVGAGQLVDSAVTTSKLDDGAVSAAKTALNAIDDSTGDLAANSVYAHNIVVVPKSLVPDPSFQAGTNFWRSHFIRRLLSSDSSVPANCPVNYASEFNDREQIPVSPIHIVGGESYKVSGYCARGTFLLGKFGFSVFFSDDLGYFIQYTDNKVLVGEHELISGWKYIEGTFVAPNNAANLYISPFIDQLNNGTKTCWFADLNCEKLNDASLIVDGTISSIKIAAKAITSEKIESDTIETNHLKSQIIVSDKIAANAIVSKTIASDAIATRHLSSLSITSEKIAVGAIGVDQLAANSITASKLAINSYGMALNKDQNFIDETLDKQFYEGSGGFLNYAKYPNTPLITNKSTAQTYCYTNPGEELNTYIDENIPIDATKNYRLSWNLYVESGNDGYSYLAIDFYDKDGALLHTSPDWGGTRSGYAWYSVGGVDTLPDQDDWNYEYGIFGADIPDRKIPNGTIYCRLGFILNSGITTDTSVAIQSLKLEELIGSTLIQDGAITTDKLLASSITGEKIAAGSITANKLLVGMAASDMVGDPKFLDQASWIKYSGTDLLFGSGASGSNVYDTYGYADNGDYCDTYSSKPIAFDHQKTYKMSFLINVESGNDHSIYGYVDLYDNSGSSVSTSWGGTHSGYPVYVASPTTGDWYLIEGLFGSGTDKELPVSVATGKAGFILNYSNGSSSTQMSIQDFKVIEVVGTTSINDGAITTEKLIAGAVTTEKIQTNSITSELIQSDAIVSGKIAAGAISANELAANAVSASKLAVSTIGAALNKDPNFTDSASWITYTGILTFATGDGVSASTYAYTPYAPSGARSENYCVEYIGLDPSRTYRLSAHFYAETGNDKQGILLVDMFDVSGGHVSTSWGGTYSGYPWQGVPADGWSFQQGIFGYGTDNTIPSNVVKCRIGFYLNYSGSSSTKMGIQGIRLEEVIGETLIQDGAITTQKIITGAITSDKIVANAITSTLLASSSVIAGKIASGVITSTEIAASTITGTNIAGGTITGTNIAASTITASNLSVTSLSAVSANLGTVTAGRAQNAANTNYIDFDATGTDKFINTGTSAWIKADGTAYFNNITLDSGVTISRTLAVDTTTLDGDWAFDCTAGEGWKFLKTQEVDTGYEVDPWAFDDKSFFASAGTVAVGVPGSGTPPSGGENLADWAFKIKRIYAKVRWSGAATIWLEVETWAQVYNYSGWTPTQIRFADTSNPTVKLYKIT